MEHTSDDGRLQVYDDNNKLWLESKQEFPDIFETLPTPIRHACKTGKKLCNLTTQCGNDRPLYSTVLKTTCNSIVNVYKENALPIHAFAY